MFKTKFRFGIGGGFSPVIQEYEHHATPREFIEKWMREGGVWDHEWKHGGNSRFIPWHSVHTVEIVSHEKVDPDGPRQYQDTDHDLIVDISPVRAGNLAPQNGWVLYDGMWSAIGKGMLILFDTQFMTISCKGKVR